MSTRPQTLASIVKYLKGIDMPADKKEILDTASRNQAPQDVIDVLQELPDQSYEGMDDLWRALGKRI